MAKLSRTKASVLNSSVASISQIVQLIVQFISRTIFIHYLGVQMLGLNGLFTNILGYLNFAELGIGAAITYSLYDPLVKNDYVQVTAIMDMFKRWYRYIALVVGSGGLIVVFFVPNLIKGGGAGLNVNVRIAFLLALANTVFSYLVTYKRTLLIADQRGYLNTINTVGFNVFGQILQIVMMIVWHSFYVYLVIQASIMLISNVRISHVVDHMYPYLNRIRGAKVDGKIIAYMKKNISGMLSAKLGGIVVTGTDNLLLSYYVGLRSVALYSNYTMITNGLSQVMAQMISAVSASIGNLGASKDDSRKKETVFYQYVFISSLVSFFISVGFAGFSSAFVSVWVGGKMVYALLPLLCISVNFYLQNLRQSIITYTNAYGLYWYARWKSIFESAVNFIISWSLVKFAGLDISGVLIGTIASNLLVNLVWEPLIVLRYGLKAPLGRMLRLYFAYTFFGIGYLGLIVWLVEKMSLVTLPSATFATIIFEIIGMILFILVNRVFYPRNIDRLDVRRVLNHFKR